MNAVKVVSKRTTSIIKSAVVIHNTCTFVMNVWKLLKINVWELNYLHCLTTPEYMDAVGYEYDISWSYSPALVHMGNHFQRKTMIFFLICVGCAPNNSLIETFF